MIKIEIDAKGYDLSDDLRKRIENRIGGLDEFMDTLDQGFVTLSWKGGKNEETHIRAQVQGHGDKFEASDTDWKPVTAIDKTRSKLETQIKKVHDERIEKRNHNRS